jgi:hypothetical protein
MVRQSFNRAPFILITLKRGRRPNAAIESGETDFTGSFDTRGHGIAQTLDDENALITFCLTGRQLPRILAPDE